MGSKVTQNTSLSESNTNIQQTSNQQIDNSQSNSNNTTTQIDQSRSADLDHIEGIGVAGNNGPVSVTQISTDQGAVMAGQKIAEAGLNFGREIGQGALDTVGETSIHAIDASVKANDRSLDFGEALSENAFSFGGKAIEAVNDTAAKAIDAQAATTGKGFDSLSSAIDKAAQATRSDSADTLQKIAKYGAIALGVIVVGAVIFTTMRKG